MILLCLIRLHSVLIIEMEPQLRELLIPEGLSSKKLLMEVAGKQFILVPQTKVPSHIVCMPYLQMAAEKVFQLAPETQLVLPEMFLQFAANFMQLAELHN